METTKTPAPDPAAARLASEVADVDAAIALVRSGVATEITLTGLRFAQRLADSLRAAAASEGVHLKASFWPEDDLGDLRISQLGGADASEDTGSGGRR